LAHFQFSQLKTDLVSSGSVVEGSFRGALGGPGVRRRRSTVISIWSFAALSAVIISVLLFCGTARAQDFDDQELAFLDAINNYRQGNGLGTLTLSNSLSVAAANYSYYMGAAGFFGHQAPDGSTPWSRIRAGGYWYNTYLGENLAAGYGSSDSVMDAWQHSPDHNANMLNPNYTAIGIDRVMVPGSKYGWYWVTEFGGVVDGDALAEQAVAVTEEPPPDNGEAGTGPAVDTPPVAEVPDLKSDPDHVFGCGVKPHLSLIVTNVTWKNFSDYITGHITVHWLVINDDTYPAFDVQITGIDTYDGARLIDDLPVQVASSLVGSKEVNVRYDLPGPWESFHTRLQLSARDECGNSYSYP
jgi:uncharacterized protein YkwD